MANITEESQELPKTLDKKDLKAYLSTFGRVCDNIPIKDYQGSKKAKKSLILYLYDNEHLRDKELVRTIRDYEVLVQLDCFSSM